ncbi:uncharacterized protein BJX67DRAFT_348466 [Aspergillus lucknowensis]|uniref:Uncharacterized protein n=1 Tax=Aspergillus lucknowensis TaxID=176173 RepID=A0ABR4LWU3_9EURO
MLSTPNAQCSVRPPLQCHYQYDESSGFRSCCCEHNKVSLHNIKGQFCRLPILQSNSLQIYQSIPHTISNQPYNPPAKLQNEDYYSLLRHHRGPCPAPRQRLATGSLQPDLLRLDHRPLHHSLLCSGRDCRLQHRHSRRAHRNDALLRCFLH